MRASKEAFRNDTPHKHAYYTPLNQILHPETVSNIAGLPTPIKRGMRGRRAS